MNWQENWDLESEYMAAGLLESIRPGDRVTIINHVGQRHTGTAVMRGPHGWVLNMGGRHGTPAVATRENICEVKERGRS